MAQWIETLEPYVKVQEQIHTATLNPVAGEDLIIGCVLIADAGPAVPTLISGQGQFLSTFGSQDITQDYLDSLNKLYKGDDNTLAATMWANAYRLAGSNALLVVRATKAKDLYFAKPLQKGDQNTYVLRDGELLKYIPSGFKMVLDVNKDDATHDQDGWSINISGVGIFGNRTTDNGPQYDYYVDNLVDLVAQLNETTKFFASTYSFYADANSTEALDVTVDSPLSEKQQAISVKFDEVFLGYRVLDTSDDRCRTGLQYIITATKEANLDPQTGSFPTQDIIDLNGTAFSGFDAAEYYAINRYNSATPLMVRIRRFNHDAVVSKELSDTEVSSLTANGESPYVVLTNVLDTFTNKGTQEPAKSVTDRDFYEVAVWDPSISNEVSFFNIGKITGRGDMETSELNDLIQMIQVNLPDDMSELGLNYYGYPADDVYESYEWQEVTEVPEGVTPAEVDVLPEVSADLVGQYKKVVSTNKIYVCIDTSTQNGENQLWADLTIDPTQFSILSVSDTDLKKALDEISLQEAYVVEGICDLGNTELSFQNYMANMAVNDNYFYPISTVNSTNYMTIGNSITKIPQDSYKLYASAPWDIDTGTLGWKYYASPAVIYWESVARNRRNNEEFASVLGSRYGVSQYSRPVVEFNRKSRQLLLSKKVNTVKWDVSNQTWEMNDSVTKTTALGDSIVNEDGNSRLVIRISKAMPVLLRQFIGRKINEKLCEDVYTAIDYWFKTVILPMGITVAQYQIFTPLITKLAQQQKIQVTINIMPQRSLKFITVYNDVYDLGSDLSVDAHNLTGEG